MSATLPAVERGAHKPSDPTHCFDRFQAELLPQRSVCRHAITVATRIDEADAVAWLRSQIDENDTDRIITQVLAKKLVIAVRNARIGASGVDALMQEFSLSTDEGVALMCLAEALLRIPDHATADRLIADKISRGDWRKHLGKSPSLFVNAITSGLLVTGNLLETNTTHTFGAAFTQLLGKCGAPLIRKGANLAMHQLGNQFVCGQTIDEALLHSRSNEARGYAYSYDMLGESALTAAHAQRYFTAYEQAIHAIGKASRGRGIKNGPGISVKLSALHPRYTKAQQYRVMCELLPQLTRLVSLAKDYNIGFNIDAEEADRLELSLDLIETLAFDPALAGYAGLGVAVQAYQKRCPWVIDFLLDLAQRSGRKMMVRLVKGAYWDTEIKRAQVDGMAGYPVYTRKAHTDLSYLVCAQKLLRASDLLYPQFATHNAQTLAAIHTTAQRLNVTDYEFQCLYGMGETLYDQVVPASALNRRCRIYAPVGSHAMLLPYLVRRLLENGANSSFVNQLVDPTIAIDMLLADPLEQVAQHGDSPHPNVALPAALFGAERCNSAGLDLQDDLVIAALARDFELLSSAHWQATPLIVGRSPRANLRQLRNPANHDDVVGSVVDADEDDVDIALTTAARHASEWHAICPAQRADILNRAANLFEQHTTELLAMLIREAGKTWPNALAEVREAVDFLRYYAAQIDPVNQAQPLGVVVCISPWNFPLAIFVGQVSAALAAGNVVLAKPAEQTPIVAWRATQLLHDAGVPPAALQLLTGPGNTIGARLIADQRSDGVVFTGSIAVAQSINRTLASRASSGQTAAVLIAETGGQNAMIVDSSAHLDQVVQDVISSAFDSAGQRCSALRILCLQDDIAERLIDMLKGAMQQLVVGDPVCLSTDIGPVIDSDARDRLQAHVERMRPLASDVFALELPPVCQHGNWVAPTIIEIDTLAHLAQEVFGPILHVLRYRRQDLPAVIDQINWLGYGLTFGIHSRIDATINFISQRICAGNIYVNRSIVGAVVGVQPFGGLGKSGTGPKAGGPHYVRRLQRARITPIDDNDVMLQPTAPALRDFQTWAVMHGHHTLSKLCEHYARTNLVGSTKPLPGPTGESNILSFIARGKVLCAAGQVDTLLNQLAAVLASGNLAILDLTSRKLLPASALPVLSEHLIVTEGVDERACYLSLAMVDAMRSASVRSQLAARDDMIVPVVDTDARLPIAMHFLAAEHTVSINNTAAGGNASLMRLAG